MEYFAGLDISMDETHVCVLDREGEVVFESKTASTAQAIADALARAPSCHRIVFETKLKDWAFAIARRSSMRKARIALARRLAIIMHAMLRDGTEFVAA